MKREKPGTCGRNRQEILCGGNGDNWRCPRKIKKNEDQENNIVLGLQVCATTSNCPTFLKGTTICWIMWDCPIFSGPGENSFILTEVSVLLTVILLHY